MGKICLFGASGHGKVILEIAMNLNIEVQAFIDDAPSNSLINGVPVVNSDELYMFNANRFIISIGDNGIRKKLSKKLKNKFTTLIHKSAIVACSSSILEGTVVMAGVVINTDAKIGKHVILNTSAIVEHDCKLDDFVHVSPNATITGGVHVGEGSHIGAGAIVIPGVRIGKWATIGAGCVIINDIPDFSVVVGNPGEIIKYNN